MAVQTLQQTIDAEHVNPVGCLMLACSCAAVHKLQSSIAVEHLHEQGIENEQHITVCYGLPENIQIADLQPYLLPASLIQLTAESLHIFEQPEYDALVLKVQSDLLQKMHTDIAEQFDVVDKYPHYIPHLTVGYFKKGKAQQYLESMQAMPAPDITPLHWMLSADGVKQLFVLEENETTEGSDLIYSGPLRISSNPLPPAYNVAQPQVDTDNDNTTLMNKQTALMRIDDIAINALASISKSKAHVDALNAFAKQAAAKIEKLPEQSIEIEDTVAQFKSQIGGLVADALEMHEAEDIETAQKFAAIKTAVEGMFGTKLTAEQVAAIEQWLAEDGKDAAKLAAQLDIDADIVAWQSVIEDALADIVNTLVDESAIEELMLYGSHLSAHSIDQRGINLIEYINKCDCGKKFQAGSESIIDLIKRQRSTSPMIAAEFVKELQNQFGDWHNAMHFGATRGGSQIQSRIQAGLLEGNAMYADKLNKLKPLLIDIARAVGCAASFSEFRNAQSKPCLAVKLVSNFMQASDEVYTQFCDILGQLHLLFATRTQPTKSVVIDMSMTAINDAVLSPAESENAVEQIIKSVLKPGIVLNFEELAKLAGCANMPWFFIEAHIKGIVNSDKFAGMIWQLLSRKQKVSLLSNLQDGTALVASMSAEDIDELGWDELGESIQAGLAKQLIVEW